MGSLAKSVCPRFRASIEASRTTSIAGDCCTTATSVVVSPSSPWRPEQCATGFVRPLIPSGHPLEDRFHMLNADTLQHQRQHLKTNQSEQHRLSILARTLLTTLPMFLTTSTKQVEGSTIAKYYQNYALFPLRPLTLLENPASRMICYISRHCSESIRPCPYSHLVQRQELHGRHSRNTSSRTRSR